MHWVTSACSRLPMSNKGLSKVAGLGAYSKGNNGATTRVLNDCMMSVCTFSKYPGPTGWGTGCSVQGSSKLPVVRQWQAVFLNESIRAFNGVVVFGQPTPRLPGLR